MSRKRSFLLLCGLAAFVLYLAIERFSVWYFKVFGKLDFSTLLLTMMSPLDGTSNSFVVSIFTMLIPVLLVSLGVSAVIWFCARRVTIQWEITAFQHKVRIGVIPIFSIVCIFLLMSSAFNFIDQLNIFTYFIKQTRVGTLYEDHYVDPDTVDLSFPDKKKNLIYIFVESLETTYADTETGGYQDVNYMPRLTALAEENLSFSQSETLGGFYSPSGTTLTVGAVLAQTSGIPYQLAAAANAMNSFRYFMPGLTTIGDILEDAGYRQYFLCGSDSTFAGKQKYFSQHGNYEIYDLYTARKRGVIPSDYYVFWGFEDQKLFNIARTELTALAESDAPFNFTMLTVDLHHVGGYICENCGSEYDTPLANVIDCNDRLITEFISWLEQQPFYEDTVIIIAGDHPRMDSHLIEGSDANIRRMYNCFINVEVVPENGTTLRQFTTMDMFPTTLAALGVEIEGDRLGLGTNIFSTTPTLVEELGSDAFYAELEKPSKYYTAYFMTEPEGE